MTKRPRSLALNSFKGKICQICKNLLATLPISLDSEDITISGDVYGANLSTIRRGWKHHCYICAAIWAALAHEVADFAALEAARPGGEPEIRYQLLHNISPFVHARTGIFELFVFVHFSHPSSHQPREVSKLFVIHPAEGPHFLVLCTDGNDVATKLS